jgi:hypothetical protein
LLYSSGHPNWGAYCPNIGVVAASAKSDSVILPSAIHLSGTRSIMVRLLASFNGASLLLATKTPVPDGCFMGLGLLSFIPKSRFKVLLIFPPLLFFAY